MRLRKNSPTQLRWETNWKSISTKTKRISLSAMDSTQRASLDSARWLDEYVELLRGLGQAREIARQLLGTQSQFPRAAVELARHLWDRFWVLGDTGSYANWCAAKSL